MFTTIFTSLVTTILLNKVCKASIVFASFSGFFHSCTVPFKLQLS